MQTALDDSLYTRLAELAARRTQCTGSADPTLRAAAENVLFHEARLLDDGHFDEWLDRFTDDGIYWIPLEPAADPRQSISYFLDDKRRVADRIGLIGTGWAHAQVPPSRTCRVVSNVEAWPLPGGDTLVRCSAVTWEYRRERLAPFVSRNDYVFTDLGDDWRLRIKIAALVDANGDVPRLSFIL